MSGKPSCFRGFRTLGAIAPSVALALFAIFITPCIFAQEQASDPESRFAAFSLSLAPTATGSLDGAATATLTWLDWLQTGAEFSDVNSVIVISDASGDSTELVNTLGVTLEAVRVNQELLWKFLPFRLDWLRLNVGIIGRYVHIDDKSYGMDAAGDNFYKNESVTWYFKPLVAFGLGVRLGPVSLDGSYENSPVAIEEYLEGSSIQSSLGVPETVDFTGTDIGLETRLKGALDIDLGILALAGKGEWFRHIGYNRYVESGEAKPYAYETVDMLFGGGMRMKFLKISGVIPYVGASYALRTFDPLDSLSGGQKASEVSHWRLDIGFGN
ncbi:MAG: hypothetical protein NT080_04230 [Spirochaetes bacterium]|nr:hypothetical protein [Spirochaetota bacterium]